MLEGKNNEKAAMLEDKTNPVGVELFSYVKTFFCYNKFAGRVCENGPHGNLKGQGKTS